MTLRLGLRTTSTTVKLHYTVDLYNEINYKYKIHVFRRQIFFNLQLVITSKSFRRKIQDQSLGLWERFDQSIGTRYESTYVDLRAVLVNEWHMHDAIDGYNLSVS